MFVLWPIRPITMSDTDSNETNTISSSATKRKPLRLWPGVATVALMLFLRFVLPLVIPDAMPVGVLGVLACGLALVIWWVFFSRARWSERIGTLVLMVLAMLVASQFVHESIATGMMGLMLPVYAVPTLSVAFMSWAVAGRKLSGALRYVVLIGLLLIGTGVWTLVKTGGFSSNLDNDFAWRWADTAEDRLLAQGEEKLTSAPAETEMIEDLPIWPAFRGANRDSVARGIKIETDWEQSPPKELWRRAVGPGWSSFSVNGSLFYTQEQRGEEEVVSCHYLATGELVWRHADHARFWESNAGAGPRGTPTLHEGRAYTLGATGILNALDARDGSLIWSRNAATDTDTKIPEWAISSSPLIHDDLVMVAVDGTLATYDKETGEPRWTGPKDGGSYSSPHYFEIARVPQVLLMSGKGATSFAPNDGTILWQHDWGGFAIVQPAMLTETDLLVSTSDRAGVRRISVAQEEESWSVEELWTSVRLKPYFNDFVIHEGHAYGFDNGIFASINIEDGERNWKGGRYGRGQVILLVDQAVLLILSERGEIALVAADPGEGKELARFKAIQGKT